MTEMAEGQGWRDIYFTARDGLRLHVRHYEAPGSLRRPALCLPGLTRNAADFHVLASRLADARGHRRPVYAVDYRGRGRSARDPDWRNYTLLVEALDILDFMTIAGLHSAAVVGTSRGGILAMIMAVLRPTTIGAVVLNDVGPVIDKEGLARIVGYVGRVPLPASWEEATALVRGMGARDFTDLDDVEWQAVARQWYHDENGRPAPSYDANLSKAISLGGGGIPDLWPQFMALSPFPLLAIRGENSDILSRTTLEQMCTRHPRIESLTVRAQGHAPLLRDEATIRIIFDFLMRSDDQHVAEQALAAY
ncbi:MAG: alpha/beta fold hydrolase [Hyphomicrobiaceae bacterium]